ncbi:MAG: Phosphoesterase RecJ domain protein [Candidatus Roizmanbacteria bacterium GW2011_GWA2_36_23]|uniref:Phosphoesterase RecJ domain protein n=1 Tax=Candidatus Roizmanbacteria bacterium GW2011_GWA2_36_23 TaxID=1618480 RepID=A0A0G0E9B1_9BACT|nr:MAG: Phosphoesterase RecJ domain protein [Candidatus Roizmanbacteria bacterium GW2011_GWA2_36_23]
MNNTQNTLARIHEIINKGVSGAIVFANNPSVDAIAAATALYLGLTKMGKNVSLASSSKVQTDLTAGDKIQSNMVTGGDSLVISFPYSDGAIDKVDYNIQGKNFNLIITPRQGFAKLNADQVNYSYTGGMLDFVIVIDSPTLQNLGTVYSENQSQFQGRDIINVDRHLTNSFFGTVNFVNKTSSSVSEIILAVLQQLQIEIDKDIATNLYAGISAATNNFTSYSVNADTFEHIAALLRAGAIKKQFKKPLGANINENNDFGQRQPQNPQPILQQNKENQNIKPIESVEKETQVNNNLSPQDWLKPKIFRGSDLV